ncbi:WD40-repeat-containing domain protein [Mycena latifolia]|nr:WD40-repeat-containing domain protein [Mycena latifolia]
MPEDAQPNDLRGRSVPAVTIRPAIPKPYRLSFKRPSDRSYTTSDSPAKRRRLDKPSRKEVIRELPPTCRKGAPGCHRERKRFIAREIESLQNSEHGLKVLSHTVTDSAVHFSCLEVDILNCSLAPSSQPVNPNHGIQQKAPSQLKVEQQSSLPPDPIIPITGPPRVFKSGTLSFKPVVPVSGETFRERIVVPRTSGNLDTDLHRLVPVAELMFGKQGPPKPTKPSSSIGETTSTSRLVKPLPLHPQPPATAANIQPPSLSNKTVDDQNAIQVPLSDFSASTSASAKDPTPPTSHDLAGSLSTGDYICELDGDEFRIPLRQQHDKLRRYLSGPLHSSSATVSMYGTLEGVDVSARKHWLIAQGPNPTKEAIDDACLVTDGVRSITVLGHGRDSQQLSLINPNDPGDGKVSAMDLKRPWNPARKGGVSAVAAMMQPLTFATGGYDHVVHLWTVQDDLASASPKPLNIKHNSQVQSLLGIRDTSHKLVSAGADCSVHIWDLSSERVVHTIKTSNSVYHAHTTASPFCTLLEVAHRELQFEVRDHRCVPTIAVQRFGYTTLQVHGRFMKGSSVANCFASGDKAGHVRLWDLRSVKSPRAQIECFDGQKIAHLTFQSSRLLACSENNQIRLVKYDQSA